MIRAKAAGFVLSFFFFRSLTIREGMTFESAIGC